MFSHFQLHPPNFIFFLFPSLKTQNKKPKPKMKTNNNKITQYGKKKVETKEAHKNPCSPFWALLLLLSAGPGMECCRQSKWHSLGESLFSLFQQESIVNSCLVRGGLCVLSAFSVLYDLNLWRSCMCSNDLCHFTRASAPRVGKMAMPWTHLPSLTLLIPQFSPGLSTRNHVKRLSVLIPITSVCW